MERATTAEFDVERYVALAQPREADRGKAPFVDPVGQPLRDYVRSYHFAGVLEDIGTAVEHAGE